MRRRELPKVTRDLLRAQRAYKSGTYCRTGEACWGCVANIIGSDSMAEKLAFACAAYLGIKMPDYTEAALSLSLDGADIADLP